MTINDLAIVDPGGNVTAIVFDAVPPSQRLAINNKILKEHALVEQVLFVERRETGVHGQMAGGEFCGNAARSLGFVLSGGNNSRQTFAMSGVFAPVIVETSQNGAKLLVDLGFRHETRVYAGVSVSIVHLEGISHAVLLPSDPLFSHFLEKALEGKSSLLPIFQELGLLDCPACGLQLVEKNTEGMNLKPYVYVHAIDTLYAETACASGSIAVTSLLGNETVLIQPSGKSLHTRLSSNETRFQAEVNGYVSMLSRGNFSG